MGHVIVDVPGDKSIATRALLLALFAEGRCSIRGVPHSRTTDRVRAVLRELGATVFDVSPGVIDVAPPSTLTSGRELYCGGSATLARILLGLLAGAGVDAVVDGSPRLRARPMARVANPINAWFGRDVVTLDDGHLPATVHRGPPPPESWTAREEVLPSAQVRSALTFAAIAARRPFPLLPDREGPWRQHLEELCDWLNIAGTDPSVRAFALRVQADPSAAAFPQALAAALPAAWISIADLYDGRGRSGFLRALAAMGARVRSSARIGGPDRTLGFALRAADVVVEAGGPLQGIFLAPGPVPPASLTPGPQVLAGELWTLIDELPLLAALCALAATPSRLCGLGELRVKESDRVARTAELLQAFGAAVVEEGDDLVIEPAPLHLPVRSIRTDGDHRIAMTALTLGHIVSGGADDVVIDLDDEGCVEESWPGFGAFIADVAQRLRSG
jgi:3-phosphoshikimate 1-carboxyvinyltransferase